MIGGRNTDILDRNAGSQLFKRLLTTNQGLETVAAVRGNRIVEAAEAGDREGETR
jgi:hypothetical protein